MSFISFSWLLHRKAELSPMELLQLEASKANNLQHFLQMTRIWLASLRSVSLVLKYVTGLLSHIRPEPTDFRILHMRVIKKRKEFEFVTHRRLLRLL